MVPHGRTTSGHLSGLQESRVAQVHLDLSVRPTKMRWCGWKQSTTREDSVIVLTDSLSLVSRLQTGKIKDSWVDLIDKINEPFKTVYIPGHAGITYNEAADHLVGKAHPMGSITFLPSDKSNRLNEKMALCCKPAQTWWSLNLLKEHGVKFGDGAKEKTRQAATKINRQKLMGVVSLHVLSQYSGGEGQRAAVPDMASTTTTTTTTCCYDCFQREKKIIALCKSDQS